jgi:hypothetical protein
LEFDQSVPCKTALNFSGFKMGLRETGTPAVQRSSLPRPSGLCSSAPMGARQAARRLTGQLDSPF